MKIMDAAARANLNLKKVSSTNGGEYAGACPKCGGRDRFRVWPEDRGGEGSYWCRQCQAGGDLVQFLVDFCSMEYPAAFREAEREMPDDYRPERYRPVLGKNTSLAGDQSEFTPRHYDDPAESWQIRAERLVNESHTALLKNDKVLGWLAARGLDEEAVKRFRLGWFPGENDKPCMFRPRAVWGLPETKNANGRPKMLWVPRGVVIPWIVGGKVRRIKIRRPGKDLQQKRDVKYYFLPGSSPEPALLCPKRKAFVVVESELDGLLVIRRAGAVAGCLILGTTGTKPGDETYHILKQSLRILDALDYDQAGAGAGKWWREEFDQAKRWPVPVGKDPGEAFEAGVDILSWIMEGLPPAITMAFQQEKAPGPEPEPVETLAQVPQEPTLPPTDPGQMYAPTVAELKRLLDRYPFKIRATDNRFSLICAPAWNNLKVKQAISQLIYFDVDVAEYLDAHPSNMIHRGNFSTTHKRN
jgi:hypothetical protein